MKQIFAGVGKIVLSVFTVAVIGLMALLSYETLGRVYPEDPIKTVYGLVLFSGGTLAWFVIFMFASRSGQRPLALTLFAVSLIGEVVYSAADVFMGGQSWVTVSPQLGQYVLWTFIAMTFAHGIGLYIHFILEPDKLMMIEIETMQDRAQDEALKKANQKVAHRIDEMAEILASRTFVNVLTGLSLPLPREVIDAQVVDVPLAAVVTPPPVQAPQLEAGERVDFGGKKVIVAQEVENRNCEVCNLPVPAGRVGTCCEACEIEAHEARAVELRQKLEKQVTPPLA